MGCGAILLFCASITCFVAVKWSRLKKKQTTQEMIISTTVNTPKVAEQGANEGVHEATEKARESSEDEKSADLADLYVEDDNPELEEADVRYAYNPNANALQREDSLEAAPNLPVEVPAVAAQGTAGGSYGVEALGDESEEG